jgi:tetratricopeptide (TPR) repeat protein
LRGALLFLVYLLITPVQAQQKAVRYREDPNNPCGLIFTKHYGPFDYRLVKGKFDNVERFHFTPNVESLVRGESGPLGADIDYTLQASPNHHRALIAMQRLSERVRTDRPPGANFPIECYYERALRFQPDDTVARGLYAIYLHKQSRTADAIKQLDVAVNYAGENPLSHYNIGLLYFENGAHEKALAEAHLARRLGWESTKLEESLKAAGKWRDPPP